MSRGETPFVYVKIPVGKQDADPFHRREDSIDQGLREKGLGWVVGWGDSLGEMQPNGARVPAYIRIDISVTDVAAAILLLRVLLPEFGEAIGMEIHYMLDGKRTQDVYAATGWLLAQPVSVSRLRVRGAWR